MAKLDTSAAEALTLPLERLGAMLTPGLEYTGEVFRMLLRCGGGAERYIHVNGTLPTLAAAMDDPERLRFLLDRGHDVNGASQAAVEALLDGCPPCEYPDVSPPPHPGALYANRRSTINAGSWEKACVPCPSQAPEFFLGGVTPLAAAIMRGSVDCVRVLLERPGVWTTECPVSIALALPWRRADDAYREACRLVRTLPDGSLRPLALWAVIEENDADFLRAELLKLLHDRFAEHGAALCVHQKRVRGERGEIEPFLPCLSRRHGTVVRHG